ncbi:galactose mutarotase [candidate division KSB1 bacterium]|nr:galactose mutarotase [candidate division KSB1 bacterium]
MNCSPEKKVAGKMEIKKEEYGTVDGKTVYLYTLTNKNGMTAKITNYGAIVQSLTAKDKNGVYEDVVLGYDKLEDYLKATPYFGAVVGRYGNRIAKGKFTLEGTEYKLATNDGENHLHGGLKGYDKVVWDAEPTDSGLKLTYLSPDGEEGYPGNLQATLIYTLTDNDELKIEYDATTDKATPVNLTHHSYFNLSGNCKTDILGHKVWINADRFTPIDNTLIPTGELRSVEGTAFDFRTPTEVGARVNNDEEQIKFGLGYDHNWVLNDVDGSLKLQASVYDESTGRYMEVLTEEPGMQFYCGNFLDGSNVGKGDKVYNYRTGLCLETQHFPDSPNEPDFPSTILHPGEKYHTQTVYRFSVK